MTKASKKSSFDYNLIKTFNEVIAAGSATKAAKRLNVSDAAVSMSLQRLQTSIPEPLFVRTHSGLVPTPRGLEISLSFRRAADIVDKVLGTTTEKFVPKKIKIFGGDFSECYYISQLYGFDSIEKYQMTYYNHSNHDFLTLRKMLVNEDVDLILSANRYNDHNLTSIPFDTMKDFVLICGSKSEIATLPVLSNESFFALSHAVYHSHSADPQILAAVDFNTLALELNGQRKIAYHSNSLLNIINVIERSNIVMLIPEKVASFFIDHQGRQLKILSLPDGFNIPTYTLYVSYNYKSPRINDIEYIVTLLKTLSSFRI